MIETALLFTLLAVAALTAGCGGGGGVDAPPIVNDNNVDVGVDVDVDVPPPGGNTGEPGGNPGTDPGNGSGGNGGGTNTATTGRLQVNLTVLAPALEESEVAPAVVPTYQVLVNARKVGFAENRNGTGTISAAEEAIFLGSNLTPGAWEVRVDVKTDDLSTLLASTEPIEALVKVGETAILPLTVQLLRGGGATVTAGEVTHVPLPTSGGTSLN